MTSTAAETIPIRVRCNPLAVFATAITFAEEKLFTTHLQAGFANLNISGKIVGVSIDVLVSSPVL